MAEKITLYPDAELKERLESIAKRERRSLNAHLLLILEQHADSQDAAPPVSPIRSVAIFDKKHIDMVTREEIDPVTLEPVKKRRRAQPCEHRIGPDQFCKVCDA